VHAGKRLRGRDLGDDRWIDARRDDPALTDFASKVFDEVSRMASITEDRRAPEEFLGDARSRSDAAA
jgi:hypothetical protein